MATRPNIFEAHSADQVQLAIYGMADDFLQRIPKDDLDVILKVPTAEDMIQYHHTVGRYIRNHYKLWERKWIPEIVNGCDVSPEHPDAISMRVLTLIWELVHHEGLASS